MTGPQRFLDNLKNVRLVMNVALEHVEQNRAAFLKNANPSEAEHFESYIREVRTTADRLENEFNTLEQALLKRKRK